MPEPIIATSFTALLCGFADCFTGPSFETFRQLMAGWVLCIGQHTVTGLIQAGSLLGAKHYSSYHYFFRAARWEPDRVGIVVLRLVLKLVPPFAPVVLVVDDTLARHTGKGISSAGMHRDPLLSTATKVAYHFGHVWVVLAVVITVPRWNKSFALPVLMRLYRSVKTCERMGIPHKKKTALAVDLILTLKEALSNREVIIVADNAFANREVITKLPDKTIFVGRGPMDAAVNELPGPRKKGEMGPPRVKGKRLPSPEKRAADPNAPWESVDVDVYGRPAIVQVLVFDALWHKSGKGRFLRFVVIRGWPGHKKDDVLICTDTTKSAKWIIETYCLRWTEEETFKWCKGKLGLEDAQNRKEQAVLRTSPMALWAYSLVVIWYLTVGEKTRGARFPVLPWYVSKKTPAFSDMLAALRRESWTCRLGDRAGLTRSTQKSLESLINAIGYG